MLEVVTPRLVTGLAQTMPLLRQLAVPLMVRVAAIPALATILQQRLLAPRMWVPVLECMLALVLVPLPILSALRVAS